jgi:hypothetical protein
MAVKEGALSAEFRTQALPTGLYWGDSAIVWDLVWPYYRNRQIEAGNFEVLSWLGKPVNKVIVDAQYTCHGFIDSIDYVEHSNNLKRFEGWARLGRGGDKAVEWVLVINSQEDLVGLGVTGVKRVDVANNLDTPLLTSWVTKARMSGFHGIVDANPEEDLSIIVFDTGDSCRIPTSD